MASVGVVGVGPDSQEDLVPTEWLIDLQSLALLHAGPSNFSYRGRPCS